MHNEYLVLGPNSINSIILFGLVVISKLDPWLCKREVGIKDLYTKGACTKGLYVKSAKYKGLSSIGFDFVLKVYTFLKFV